MSAQPAASCAAFATLWRVRARRRSGSSELSGSLPPKWSRRSARFTSCGPVRSWSCSQPRGCGPKPCIARGCVSATARPLALADAQSHPNFAYRPETGEEVYHSLMGVPILRGNRVLGVLAVQNRTLRHYTEDEVEVLQTIAMIVAELAASGNLVNPLEMAQSQGGGMLPARIAGGPSLPEA